MDIKRALWPLPNLPRSLYIGMAAILCPMLSIEVSAPALSAPVSECQPLHSGIGVFDYHGRFSRTSSAFRNSLISAAADKSSSKHDEQLLVAVRQAAMNRHVTDEKDLDTLLTIAAHFYASREYADAVRTWTVITQADSLPLPVHPEIKDSFLKSSGPQMAIVMQNSLGDFVPPLPEGLDPSYRKSLNDGLSDLRSGNAHSAEKHFQGLNSSTIAHLAFLAEALSQRALGCHKNSVGTTLVRSTLAPFYKSPDVAGFDKITSLDIALLLLLIGSRN